MTDSTIAPPKKTEAISDDVDAAIENTVKKKKVAERTDQEAYCLLTCAIVFNERFSWLLDTRKDDVKNKILNSIFLFANEYRTVTSWGHGAPYFRIYGREPVSKPATSLKTSPGGGGYLRTTPGIRVFI